LIATYLNETFARRVEAVIFNHPAVREAAVFGIPDPQWGELVAACVVLKPGMAITTEELIRHCR
jgi:acyl-CoA synthetase (AMP-forming)/AMP-acid ligase II